MTFFPLFSAFEKNFQNRAPLFPSPHEAGFFPPMNKQMGVQRADLPSFSPPPLPTKTAHNWVPPFSFSPSLST